MSFFPSLGFGVSVCQTLLLELRKRPAGVSMLRSAIKGVPAHSFTGRGCISPHRWTVTSLDFARSAPWDPRLAATEWSLSKEAEAYLLGTCWAWRPVDQSLLSHMFIDAQNTQEWLCAAAKSEWQSLFARTYCRNGVVMLWEELASPICHISERSVSLRPSHSYDRGFFFTLSSSSHLAQGQLTSLL